jgi:acetyl esterase/lipase
VRPEDYPPQEPLSEAGARYHDMVMALGAGVEGIDVRYDDDPYQSIALHVPARPNGTVLAFLHGGGWTNGYKEWLAFMAPPLTAAGVLFASVGYRLAPGHIFPAGFDDTCAAIRWLHRYAGDHGGDPARLFVGGHSAGGHYAALAAVRHDWQDRLDLPPDVVRGCLPISGVYLFGPGAGLAMRPRFLGGEASEQPASPLLNIAEAPPPFLLAYGSDDFPHLMRQAEDMERALANAGGDVRSVVMSGRNHFTASTAGGEPDGPWLPKALAWMEER